jgi:hypothetical protein
MDGRQHDHDEAPLTLQLELRLAREPISGRLRGERGADEEFVGWLGFVEALRRLSEAQTERRD